MSNLGIVMTRTSNFVNYAAQYVFDATNHYGEICCGTLSWACCTCNCSTGICLRIFLDKFRSNTDSFSDISTNNSSKINNLLEITEESVNILSVYTESKISSIDDIRDDTKRKEITNDIKNFTKEKIMSTLNIFQICFEIWGCLFCLLGAARNLIKDDY